jgi:hypothetical protein
MRRVRCGVRARHAFAVDRLLLQHVPPERGTNSRVMLEQVKHRSAGNRGEPRRHKCADRMVHGIEQKSVQVEDVAGDQKGQNLSFAVGEQPVSACHPAR